MAIDWSHVFEKYKGMWVAFADDERTVLAAGETAKEALDKAKETGQPYPILARMPDRLVSYSTWEGFHTELSDRRDSLIYL